MIHIMGPFHVLVEGMKFKLICLQHNGSCLSTTFVFGLKKTTCLDGAVVGCGDDGGVRKEASSHDPI